MSGYDLKNAYESVCRADDMLESSIKVAFNEKLGYLTKCPTNLGTGMRASVMMFLPMMTLYKQIGQLQDQLTKIGLTVRGLYGEGSPADGCLFQISNDETLGHTEDETLKKLSSVIDQICSKERELRKSLKGNDLVKLEDQVMRAYGTMKYATLISSSELFSLYSQVKLGASMGMLKDVDPGFFDKVLIKGLPAAIISKSGNEAVSPMQRDRLRAESIKEMLKSNES